MNQLIGYLSSFDLSSFGPWLVDILVVVVILLYFINGWQKGAITLLADFISFLTSLILALRFYSLPAGLLFHYLPLPVFLANAMGFLLIGILAQTLLSQLLGLLADFLPQTLNQSLISRFLALPLSLLSALLLIAFFLVLLVAAPVAPQIKSAILSSRLGSPLVLATTDIQRAAFTLIGNQPPQDSLTFFTLHPDSYDRLDLKFSASQVAPDSASEIRLATLINAKRQSLARLPLTPSPRLTQVAQTHAQDLLQRGYASHFSLEEQGATQRVGDSSFTALAEIVILSPTADFAYQGLIRYPPHLNLISQPTFTHIGVGAADADLYGKAFVILLAHQP